MKCPICSSDLQKNDDYYICSNKHGVLINSKHLVNKHKVKIDDVHDSESSDKQIPCPKCKNIMHKTDYNNTGVMIDSCMKCHSRWLDAGEFRKIKYHKQTLSPEQLLYLLEVDKVMQIEKKEKLDDKIPHYATGYVGGLGRGLSAFDSKRTLGWIGSGAIIGTIRVLVKGNKYQKGAFAVSFVLFFAFMFFLWSMVNNN